MRGKGDDILNIVIWVINILGIGISAWGAWEIYKGTPLDSLGVNSSMESHISHDEAERLMVQMRQRREGSLRGIKLLGSGFVLQGVAQILSLSNLLN